MDKNKIIREELEKMQTKDSKSPCRIKYRGEFLTTSTGKTVWSDTRGAKLALREEDFFKTLYSEVEFVNV